MEETKKKIHSFIDHPLFRWAIVAAIFLFLEKMVWTNWNQVRNASFTFEVIPLLLCTLIFAFSYFIQIWAWYLITSSLICKGDPDCGDYFYPDSHLDDPH